MSLVSTIVDPVLHLHGTAAYAVVGGLAFAEAAAFVGFVLPGETAVILGGVLAYRGSVSLSVMIAVVVVCAIAGDSVGYEIGRRYGARLLTWRRLDRYRTALDNGQERLRTRGGVAVFLGRFTAFLRAVMPAMAGASRMPYRTFLVWNAIGGAVWATASVLLGYLAGASYTRFEGYAGKVSDIVLAVIVVALVAWGVRRKLQERDPADD